MYITGQIVFSMILFYSALEKYKPIIFTLYSPQRRLFPTMKEGNEDLFNPVTLSADSLLPIGKYLNKQEGIDAFVSLLTAVK
jgi:hypothetical protein